MAVLVVVMDVNILLDNRCAEVKNSAREQRTGRARNIGIYLNCEDVDDDDDDDVLEMV